MLSSVKLFKNKKIVVMGLGLVGGGVGVAKFFAKHGAKVLVTDLRRKRELKPSLDQLKNLEIDFVLGKHRKQDFKNADLIVKNPAVRPDSPYLKIAKEHNIPIETDVSIFFDLCPGQIIGVTGTKGKSIVATLIYLFLKKKYPNTVLAGNIGISPLEILPKVKKETKIVLELSSFELENLKKSPQIAIVTTLFPDHLNRYKNFKDYIESKKPIFKYQKKNDVLFLNKDNSKTKGLSSQAKSKVYFFSDGFAARAVAEFFKISKKDIEKVLSSFKGIPNRQEFICIKKGVKYFNDTTATTPQSVILAIKRFSNSRIILIAGGQDKELSYRELAKEIKKNIKYLILLPGTASDKIKKELFETRSRSADRDRVSVFLVKSMKEAIKKASKLAQRGDVVLLSPGAASFNLFKNEFDRGEQFKKNVKAL